MTLRCEGCGAEIKAGPDAPFPFRCPQADALPAVDHVLTPALEGIEAWPRSESGNPFEAWRTLSHSHALALEAGLGDEGYLALLHKLDSAIAEIEGHGFQAGVVRPQAGLSEALGVDLKLWDETAQVAGSHKARHLMGIALHLEIVEALGWATVPDLAIASCGNAALAAAVVSKAAGRRLRVFIPTDANPQVIARLEALGAQINISPRREGEAGDPCIHRFREALAEGALPFCCQGSENGLTLEGGQTLAYDLTRAMPEAPDHLFIQVGGGALSSAVSRGIFEAVEAGVWSHAPKIHLVQTEGAAPLARAFGRLEEKIAEVGLSEALAHAKARRAEYMWPWEETPHSVAHGILDDETYDWIGCVSAMARSGGSAPVVEEAHVIEAHRLVNEAGIESTATGTASLAGLLALRQRGVIEDGARVCCLITG